MTLPTQLVLQVLLLEPAREKYGLQICSEAGLPGGTTYPILARLEMLGWVASYWEDSDAARREGRPARRYYQLTQIGAERAGVAMDEAAVPLRVLAGLRSLPEGGTA